MACAICGGTQLDERGDTCQGCGWTGRNRSFLKLLDRLPGGEAALCISDGPHVQARIAKSYPAVTSAVLYGDYGPGTITGVDVVDLSRFESGSFDLISACAVFDYVERVEEALVEGHRVLREGGAYAIYFMPNRLSDGDAPPRVRKLIGSKGSYLSYLPAGVKIPHMQFTRNWLLEAMKRARFRAEISQIGDGMTDRVHEWFLCRKG